MAKREIWCVVLIHICMPTLLAAVSHENSTFGRERCSLTTSHYEDLRSTFLAHNFTLRLSVDAVNGSNDTACLNGSHPCRTLNYALCQGADQCTNDRGDTVVSFHSLEVYLAPGRHRLTSRVQFRNSSFIHIYGDSSQETALLCAQAFPNQRFPCVFDNLDFLRSNHTWLSGITITNCGPVAAGVFMRRVSDVIIQNCTFTQNAGPALSVLRHSNRLYLVDNIIYNNTGLSLPEELAEQFCGSIRITVFFRFRGGGSGGFDIRAEQSTKEILVLRNSFIDNAAVPDFNNSNITIPDSLRPFGRGGAMSIGMQGSSDCHVCIKDTVVRGNRARLAAGGVSLYLSNGATRNSMTIENSVVEDNWCSSAECLGGGVHFTADGQINDTTINTMYVYDTMFVNNSAGTGGGYLGVLYSSESGYVFSNCTFMDNKGRFDGSALVVLSMASVDRGGNDLYCFDCHFENNIGLGESLVDVAAVRLYRVRFTLNSTTDSPSFFSNNSGGGLDITQGLVNVITMVTFEGNEARLGAGMRLSSRTEVFLTPGSTLTFVGNHADRLGGAIFVNGVPNQIEPRFRLNACFLQSGIDPFMDTPPQKWNVTVSFHGNGAKEGGSAIYSSDFEYCCWLGGEDDTPNCSSALVFVPHPEYQPPFDYRHSNGTAITEKEDIFALLATDAQHIAAKPQSLKVAYGETVQTNLSLTDAFNHSLSAVFSTEAGKLRVTQPLGSSVRNHDDAYVFSVEGPAILSELRTKCANNSRDTPTGEICLERVEDSVEFSIFAGQGKSEENTTVTLDISQCNPGYAFHRNSSTCVCRTGENYEYRQFTCDRNGRIYIPDGIAVSVSADEEFYFVFVPLSYVRCTRSREVANLPVCEIRFDRNLTEQCAVGRTGTLCGTCKAEEGFCLSMDLQYCLKQEKYSPLGGICYLAICVFAVVGCIVILYFNIGVPNELRGFFFYAQVIGVVYRNYRLFSEGGGAEFFSVLLNLLGTTLPFPLCISSQIQATWMAVLGYVPPLLALTTVGIFVLSARYVRRLAGRSTLSGITLIILLSYKYLTDSSFFFINCIRLQDGVGYVNRLTGQPCFSAPHVELFVFSILITLGIVAPLPFFFIVITCKHFKRTMHFSDALSKGMRVPCRWYAAWDILRRILFVIVALMPGLIIPHRLLALLLFEMVMLVVHCLSKPYEKKWINVVEALILLDLFVATAAILQQKDRYITRWLGGVVVILPFVYAAAVGSCLVGKYLWTHCLAAKWKERLVVFFSPVNWRSPFPNRSGADEGDRSSFYVSDSLNDDSDELSWLPRMAPRPSRNTQTDNWDRQALFQESLLSHDDED